ncbi:hypothetical protein OG331_50490 [Streptomyces sp. NBC_01017]|uniref:hypothetical protein n=1 Tax=Streptomyces sp. NBC_01017 TaxID=2903721 RepID=UPI003867E1BD|nr:hypothetical protein OG331_01485 [Streptomyces sp. NBC_01017]WSV35169.1 hypothetical protein OG331_50490 [Streptomyces sp. NBC_01017]
MTAQSVPSAPGPGRIPRTQDAVAAALSPAQRMEFYRQMGEATDDTIGAVLRRWWTLVQVASDPVTARTAAAVQAKTAPGRGAASVLRER